MKIEILSIALVDIQSGQHFYEQQQEGLGAYFLDLLFSDIDALCFTQVFTNSFSAITVRSRSDFPTQFTIG